MARRWAPGGPSAVRAARALLTQRQPLSTSSLPGGDGFRPGGQGVGPLTRWGWADRRTGQCPGGNPGRGPSCTGGQAAFYWLFPFLLLDLNPAEVGAERASAEWTNGVNK